MQSRLLNFRRIDDGDVCVCVCVCSVEIDEMFSRVGGVRNYQRLQFNLLMGWWKDV